MSALAGLAASLRSEGFQMTKPIPRPLMVIVVPPDTIVNGRKLSDTFDVVVGDCIYPGFVVAAFPDAETADVFALAYGQELGMSVLPMTGRLLRTTEAKP